MVCSHQAHVFEKIVIENFKFWVFFFTLFVKNITDLEWDDIGEYAPAIIAMITMPLTYSISNGIALAFITYALVKILSGRVQNVSPAIWLVAVLSGISFSVYNIL